MEFLLPALLVSLPIILSFILQRLRPINAKTLPPGPPGLPIIGNLHQIDSNSSPHLQLWEMSKKYGPLMSLKMGFKSAVVVSNAKMAREVFKTHDLAFSSRPMLTGQQKLSYGGLDLAFAPYGDYWREMRRVCFVHLFSTKKLQAFRFIREEEVSVLIETVKAISAASKAANLSELMITLSSGSICRIAFGRKYSEKFQEIFNEAQALMALFFVSDYLPFMGWFDTLTGLRGRLDKSFRELDSIYQRIIDEHLVDLHVRPQSDRDDITYVLLRLKNDDAFRTKLTFDHIKANIMNILVGGTDTIAATVVWAMTELIKNPHIMNKAKKELENVVTKDVYFIKEDDLPKLVYLKAVIKETLRLHTVAPLVPRQTIERCVIDGYEIKPETLVYINAGAVMMDPEYWENPKTFLPERFMKSNSKDFKGQDFEFVPFGAGRRICPGLNIGVLTAELSLANLIWSFDWEMPSGTRSEDIDMEVLPGLTMHKKVPLSLVPHYLKGE